MLKSVHTILLYVRDVQSSINYYRDKRGFNLEFMSADGGVAGLRLGDVGLILHSDRNVQPGYLPEVGKRGRGVVLHFEVEDVDRYHEELKKKGVEISLAPVDQSFGLRTMYVYDPDGYNLCFVHPLSKQAR
ncbi:MAG: VOC family protein [bacterium JZ-2024 1]